MAHNHGGNGGGNFDSFGDFANFLDTVVQRNLEKVPALERAAYMVEQAAKEEMGVYQRSNMGPFKRWGELAPSTKRERVKLGFTENDPLLRRGDLQKSISHETSQSGNEAVIGSPDQRLVWLELGTKYMAPRSVLGLAAWRKRKQIIKLVGGLTVSAILNIDISTTPGVEDYRIHNVVFHHKGGD